MDTAEVVYENSENSHYGNQKWHGLGMCERWRNGYEGRS